MPKQTYDVIVIGTGAGGGMAIKTLCEAGLKVCALNSELGRFAGSRAVRRDVVKNSVIARSKLVDRVGRKKMLFRDRDIATMVRDVLRAGECTLLGESR